MTSLPASAGVRLLCLNKIHAGALPDSFEPTSSRVGSLFVRCLSLLGLRWS